MNRIARRIRETLRLMIGIPDYDRYRAHRTQYHPDAALMSYEDFFRERQESRYAGKSGKISRCC